MVRDLNVPMLLACACFGALGCTTTVQGNGGGPFPTPDGIVAMGHSEVTAAPELARVNVGVEATSPTVAGAMAEATQRATSITKTLREMGVADEDINSSGFSLFPIRPEDPRPFSAAPPYMTPPPPPAPPPNTEGAEQPALPPVAGPPPLPPQAAAMTASPQGYRVVSGYEVTLRDLNRIGQILEALTQAGANRVLGIACDVEDRKALAQDARAKAVANAQARAEQIAKAARVQLGEITGIADSQSEVLPPPPMLPPAMAMEARAGGKVIPIQCDRVRLDYAVMVKYEIE